MNVKDYFYHNHLFLMPINKLVKMDKTNKVNKESKLIPHNNLIFCFFELHLKSVTY